MERTKGDEAGTIAALVLVMGDSKVRSVPSHSTEVIGAETGHPLNYLMRLENQEQYRYPQVTGTEEHLELSLVTLPIVVVHAVFNSVLSGL